MPQYRKGEQNRREPYNKMAEAMHESCSLSFHRPRRTARKTQWCRSRWSKGARKRRRVQWGSTTQSKASVRKEVNSEEHHSAAEADLPIVKEGMQMQVNG
ncbi:hypothetical protein BHE74_00009135 [Ensete ventricosum]|nr:hypothetical protein BHE74_00009135 [Ensete ventricosum]